MVREVLCRTSPSLALVKYWGKMNSRENLPATPSLAVTLGGVVTETRVRAARKDSIRLGGEPVGLDRFLPLLESLRRAAGRKTGFEVESRNNFPSSAGLASSSSGFAALTVACARLLELELAPAQLSALARTGSASAARSLFGGFTLLPAGGFAAQQLYGAEYWPQLRIVIALVSREAKPISSRSAMEATRESSPYYRAWLRNAGQLLDPALHALDRRDIRALGFGTPHDFVELIEKHDAVLLDPFHGPRLGVLFIDHARRLLFGQEFHRLFDPDLARARAVAAEVLEHALQLACHLLHARWRDDLHADVGHRELHLDLFVIELAFTQHLAAP